MAPRITDPNQRYAQQYINPSPPRMQPRYYSPAQKPDTHTYQGGQWYTSTSPSILPGQNTKPPDLKSPESKYARQYTNPTPPSQPNYKTGSGDIHTYQNGRWNTTNSSDLYRKENERRRKRKPEEFYADQYVNPPRRGRYTKDAKARDDIHTYQDGEWTTTSSGDLYQANPPVPPTPEEEYARQYKNPRSPNMTQDGMPYTLTYENGQWRQSWTVPQPSGQTGAAGSSVTRGLAAPSGYWPGMRENVNPPMAPSGIPPQYAQPYSPGTASAPPGPGPMPPQSPGSAFAGAQGGVTKDSTEPFVRPPVGSGTYYAGTAPWAPYAQPYAPGTASAPPVPGRVPPTAQNPAQPTGGVPYQQGPIQWTGGSFSPWTVANMPSNWIEQIYPDELAGVAASEVGEFLPPGTETPSGIVGTGTFNPLTGTGPTINANLPEPPSGGGGGGGGGSTDAALVPGGGGGGGSPAPTTVPMDVPVVPQVNQSLEQILTQMPAARGGETFEIPPALQKWLTDNGMYDRLMNIFKTLGFVPWGDIGAFGYQSDFFIPRNLAVRSDQLSQFLSGLSPTDSMAMNWILAQMGVAQQTPQSSLSKTPTEMERQNVKKPAPVGPPKLPEPPPTA